MGLVGPAIWKVDHAHLRDLSGFARRIDSSFRLGLYRFDVVTAITSSTGHTGGAWALRRSVSMNPPTPNSSPEQYNAFGLWRGSRSRQAP